jgi:hypothetical protein
MTYDTDLDADGELVPVELLSPDGDLLEDIQRHRGLGTATKVLLGGLVVALAFLAGVVVQKHQGDTSSANGLPAGLPSNVGALFGGNGATDGSSRDTNDGSTSTGNGTTIGTVKLVDGNNVYVSDVQGNVVKVTTGSNTDVQVSKTGTLTDLQPGTSVVVQGKAGSSDEVAATSITETSNTFGGTGGLPGGGLPQGFPGGASAGTGDD